MRIMKIITSVCLCVLLVMTQIQFVEGSTSLESACIAAHITEIRGIPLHERPKPRGGLELDRLGFEFDWRTPESSLRSMEYAFDKNIPHIMKQYRDIDNLSEQEIKQLREQIYALNKGYFFLFGIGGARSHTQPWGASYIDALEAFFDHPKLEFSAEEMLEYRYKHSVKKYMWEGGVSVGVDNIKHAIKRYRPDIIERYENYEKLSKEERAALRGDIYTIREAHFNVWGIGAALQKKSADYFNGSYVDALMMTFHKVNMNPLDISLDWSDKDSAYASFRHVLLKEYPSLIRRYEDIWSLSNEEVNQLKHEVYSITRMHFEMWGLSGMLDRGKLPLFQGSYIKALQRYFAGLRLNKFGFNPDYSTPQNTITSIKIALYRYAYHIMKRYENYDVLSDAEKDLLKQDILRITSNYLVYININVSKVLKQFPEYFDLFHQLFPKIDFHAFDFAADWSTPDKAREYILYVLAKEEPSLIDRYDRIDELTEDELKQFKKRYMCYQSRAF